MKDSTKNPLAKAADKVQKTDSGKRAFEILSKAIPGGVKPSSQFMAISRQGSL